MADDFEAIQAASDVYGYVGNEGQADTGRNFDPWDKPRKQWIRDKQWWSEIRSHLIDSAPDRPLLKYLGLPGESLLDVRFFQERLSGENRQLYFYGLISGQPSWQAAQENLSVVLDQAGCHEGSKVQKHDFDEIREPNAALLAKIKETGPFDILNLDFCDNIIAPSKKDRRLTAIRNLLEYQCHYHKDKWLLLITTRSSPGSSCGNMFSQLAAVVQKNLGDAEFRAEMVACASSMLDESQVSLIEAALIDDEKHINIYIMGLVKWIFAVAVGHHCKARLTTIFRYDSDAEVATSDMISMAIVIEKVPKTTADAYGVVSTAPSPALSESAMARPIIRKIVSMRSVDQMIKMNPITYAEMAGQKMRLLSSAGRSIEGYVEELCLNDIQEMNMNVDEFNAMLATLG